MIDRDIALEALGVLCNASVTSVQIQRSQSSHDCSGGRAAHQEQLSIKNLICTVLDADETSEVSKCCFSHIQSILQGSAAPAFFPGVVDTATGRNHIIDDDEFFAPQFDYDFKNLKDTETFWRGGEKYERPSGWYRFGLKVLDKYDEATWLGTSYRSTQSCPGEWPVSYHGTSKKGAEGIIEGHYEPGSGQAYGRGIYSTPDISEANQYAKTFTSEKNGKRYKVILQNRINPKYRKICKYPKYWLIPIPKGTSDEEEQEMVERAIRPYGLLLKEV
ncbi:uncharacterized protein LOC111236005 [Seriola dumerili]|uniref:uncharacterized protein LOC111236005 n=1 Tax=Seriola dumerili TaxID=41447 RepID=UPI000BBE75BC|nr:uncharacterized protein LOC111236005 [Seriola dumerili]